MRKLLKSPPPLINRAGALATVGGGQLRPSSPGPLLRRQCPLSSRNHLSGGIAFSVRLFGWHAIIASGRVRSFSDGGAKIAR
jgi:hypothetical protein